MYTSTDTVGDAIRSEIMQVDPVQNHRKITLFGPPNAQAETTIHARNEQPAQGSQHRSSAQYRRRISAGYWYGDIVLLLRHDAHYPHSERIPVKV